MEGDQIPEDALLRSFHFLTYGPISLSDYSEAVQELIWVLKRQGWEICPPAAGTQCAENREDACNNRNIDAVFRLKADR